ncbi:PREDICTED: FERM and PDZ domain-containing protein 1-like [Cyprinodon variegatus]|uniref:FERM and PDZ domain-containing protein 1-like n=1 Tax=Cyprinodon variegatus TaxID=28743 RepID=UPI000742535C|nr:PREDICTED: FERM and PDZ domain-containing protein 1-like [Cyprinodon variegatus]XP_015243711.1 PREDICTED: FERM and PDZ domain-containing protein 1-like [Cyprinodon variegatus]
MESQDRSRSPSRRTSRVEQVVGRWLRRSRDLGSRSLSLSRDRVAVDGKTGESSGSDQRNYPFRFNIQIQKDLDLNSHGLTLSTQIPILVEEVMPGGPADGRLVPGDQLVKINDIAVDDLTPEQAAEIIRECQDTLTMTVLRIIKGPKSSFITPEKRAKLRSNPVKVHFAEEVEVNGQSQGNSLLFLPNVLKVYLENGQTKAFKFEISTTVKDIVMTLKEKLSLNRIEHFSLVLEQQHNSSRLLLLHDEERIHQVVQKKEVHNYRCLFRVCFLPKDFKALLQEDPAAFEYLYLQGVNDVLQERYAVEMRCNAALRLAALHIQERLVSSGQSPKANLKMITKTWGIENFVSSTLLRNMREKDLRKAISFHLKKTQSHQDPRQKALSVEQARINYLEELSDLKSFGGKSFGATLMLQDRESMVSLLVGARYGVSQVVNHKLSIMTTLTEFNSITRVELLPESDKVSLVKIYLQDIKPITLLLEASAAKDMSCLIAGYCRVFIDPNLNVFPWMDDKKHRVSAEEGYVSRCGSDSEDSSDLDMEPLYSLASQDDQTSPRVRSSSDPDGRKRKDRDLMRSKDNESKGEMPVESKKLKQENSPDTAKETSSLENNGGREKQDMVEVQRHDSKIQIQITDSSEGQKINPGTGEEEQPTVSEASDSCHTDSRVLSSPSSDSLDALEEDDLISCSSSSVQTHARSQAHVCTHSPIQLHFHSDGRIQPHLLAPPPLHSHPLIHLTVVNCGREPEEGEGSSRSGDGADPKLISTLSQSPKVQKHSSELCSADSSLCFAELSRLVDLLPSPPEASEDDDAEEDDLQRKAKLQCGISGTLRTDDRRGVQGHPLSTSPSSPSSHKDFFFNFDQSDARCYYNLCSNITPDSAHNLPGPQHPNSGGSHKTEVKTADPEPVPILQPPPGFGDSSSDDEFFDARDRFTSPEDPTSGAVPRGIQMNKKLDSNSCVSLSDIRVSVMDINKDKGAEMDKQKEEEERGSKETMFLLRKRSRKRRSFMETDYTSQVTYPESDLDSESNLNSCRLQKNILTDSSDNTILTSDPEPSEQTQNPSLTVSSLTHAEGEPAQLESKPILSKLHSHGPGFLSASEQTRNLKPPSRTRKQEMEMEPDAMESKSVTDLVKVVPPTITVVRCRVDPDGKESADRRGDGKEEGEDQEEMSGRKGESKEEKPACLTGNGPFTTHMFLPDIIEEEEKDDVKKEKMFQLSSSLKRPLVGAEISQDATLIPNSLTEVNKNVVTTQINTHVDKHFPTFITSPPPPPPSRLLPQTPTGLKLDCETLVKEAELHKTIETSIKLSALNLKEEISCHSDTAQSIKQTLVSINDEELIGIQESTESSNSDNVFEDEDDAHTSFSPNCTSDEHQYDRTVSANSSLTQGTTDKLHIDAQLHLNCEEQIRGLNADHILAIKSIRAKLEATTNIISSLNSGTELKNMGISKPKSDSSLVGGATADSSGSPSIVIPKAATLSDLSKDLTPPARFLFQTYSPSIMGRLSASTLRGKIQNLPLYLSRSQESLTQAGVESSAQSPAKEACRNEAYPLDGFHDITQTFDLEMGLAPDSAESDDSDATLTGSELDGEFFLETASAQRSPLTPEKKEVSFELPVQTEPKQHHQTLYAGPNDNTPGPVTEPPTSIIHFFQRDSSGLNAHMPGPIKDAPELNIRVNNLPEDIPGYKDSSQSPIVVTTQNLNGPQLAFYGQSQKVRRTSNDRPLMGLCRPLEQISDPSKVPSTSCKVFTICEDLSQKSPSSDLVSATPLKAEFGCSSLFASGCESVAEGVQVPLDACGCPASYTNCFSGEESFDDELTVYEFSCRSQNSSISQTSRGGLHLITSPTAPSFISTSSTLSPSYPNPILLSTSTSELSPLLSPPSESSNSYLSQAHKDTLRHLGQQHYPEPPEGFQVLRRDVDKLLTILEGSNSSDRSVEGLGGRHPRDTCPAHFTENKRVLQLEARRLMSGCQKVAGTGQSPDEMLKFLADSFQTLVELASVCLWFSGCDRCDRRNAEAWAGLADVARSFRDFCLAAERASSKRSCQDLSTKLLAKQCTALTASVFCLTQLFRTLTAL